MSQEKNEEKPLGVLFGVLAYNSQKELEEFMEGLHSGSHANIIMTIHAALRYAQASGVFSLEEAEAVSVTLRKMKGVPIIE